MDPRLNGMHIAIIVADGFEQIELTEPKVALEEEGAITKIISTSRGKVQGMNRGVAADEFVVDLTFDDADAKDFDAVVLPGGAGIAQRIGENQEAQLFVQSANADHKPIVAIGHGATLLISAKLIEGRTLAASPTLKSELVEAGGIWVDQPVAIDGNLVTSRAAQDLPVLIEKMIEVIAARMQEKVQGTEDEHAVGIASS